MQINWHAISKRDTTKKPQQIVIFFLLSVSDELKKRSVITEDTNLFCVTVYKLTSQFIAFFGELIELVQKWNHPILNENYSKAISNLKSFYIDT